ncbi:ABC transporter ATP-binding protein [Pleomorphomonas carboxyditropha]|uniref:ABC transporter ATP-binding protein n=1 Tax=Pleomorphomonas carboxyditropha TaxID=2023338 RepID=A0A2G9WZJ7_9HYPH|nr:sn-glycerol-3-phosphate ABC transporter ATP-binding protein UgpC [Pleomorphomonas carboxyditropha]PIP00094.1 ABC transporter ATP-binding protein [Pleomorphomonas carboxyditropha]
MAALTFRSVGKTFGDTEVIRSVDLDVDDGEFVVFVGPSGCGKSTLLRMLAGLENTTSGTIAIDGRDVTGMLPIERGVAMVFQSYALYPHMTVEDNIGFGLRIAGVPKAERQRQVRAAAEILQLTPYLQRKPKALSGGQRQRVAIGRAIVKSPKIFLFDEPLSNLDAELRVQMRLEIAALHQRLGATMIYVTHDQVEAMTLADKIVVLRGGRVEQVGRPIELYEDPDNLFVAGFIGSPKMNFLSATVLSVTGKVAEVDVPGLGETPVFIALRGVAAPGQPVTLGFRPERAAIDPEGSIAATARTVEQLGSVSYVYADGVAGASVTIEERGHSDLRPGEAFRFSLDATGLFLFDADGKRL